MATGIGGLNQGVGGVYVTSLVPFAVLDAAHRRLLLKPRFRQHCCFVHVFLYLFLFNLNIPQGVALNCSP